MMSTALNTLMALFILSMTSALPQDQNYIRTQRKISNNYNPNVFYPGEHYYQNNRNGHVRNKSFRTRAGLGNDVNDLDYDDIDPAPIEFVPARTPSPLDSKLPNVDGSMNTDRPQQRPVKARPADPARPPGNPGATPGRKNGNERRRGLSTCGNAIVRCCHLSAYQKRLIPRCFEQMGCPGGYYDAPCSSEKQNKIPNYLKRF